MWLLGQILPGMIGHYISQDDEHWLNFLVLLQIMDYLLCLLITTDEVAYLQLLIANITKHSATYIQVTL